VSAVAESGHLGGASLTLALLLAGYLVLGQPVVGAYNEERFQRAVGRDPGARLARYRRSALTEWALVAVSALLVAASPGLDLADVGVRWPRLSGGAAPYTVVGGLGLILSGLLLAGLRRRVDRGRELRATAGVAALLPRTAAERRAFTAVALTAGICEETLYRGVLLGITSSLLPGLSPGRLALVSALAFGLAHTYQGVAGMLSTAILGGCLAVLYLGSGSLLLPILYHVLVDLRVLVLAVGRRGQGRHAASRTS